MFGLVFYIVVGPLCCWPLVFYIVVVCFWCVVVVCSTTLQAKRYFILTLPENNRWCDQQNSSLKALIPKLVNVIKPLENMSESLHVTTDLDEIQGLVDNIKKTQDEFHDIKSSVNRLLGGKRTKRGLPSCTEAVSA